MTKKTTIPLAIFLILLSACADKADDAYYSAANIGGSPRGIALSPADRCRLYIAVDMGVTILDVCKNKILRQNWSPVNDKNSLLDPQGIAVEKNNSYWVADRGRNAVVKFKQGGEKEKGFNAGKAPTDVRALNDGSVLVVDSERRLFHIAADGKMIGQTSVESVPHEERTKFNSSSVKFTMNSAGTPIWVDNNLKAWLFPWRAHPETSGWMAGPNQLVCSSTTGGAFVSPDGHIYIADGCGITKYNSNGESVTNVSIFGTQIGSTFDVQSIIPGPDNSMFVADTGNLRIQQLSSIGAVIHVWGPDVSLVANPGKMAVTDDDTIRILSSSRGIIYKFKDDPATASPAGYWKHGDDMPPQVVYDILLAGVDDDNNKYFLTDSSTYSQGRLIIVDKNGSVINQVALQDTDTREQIKFLAIGKDGVIYIWDKEKQKIRRFTKRLKELAPISSNNELFFPAGIAVGDDGNIYVADGGGCVWKSDPGGQFKEECKGEGVKIFSPRGDIIRTIREVGKDGHPILPDGIGRDRHGFIYVAYSDAIVKYSPSGSEMTRIPRRYHQISHGPYYLYLAVDSRDNIYLTDDERDVPLEIYDQNGHLRQSFSSGQSLDEFMGYREATPDENAKRIDFSNVFASPTSSKIHASSGRYGKRTIYTFNTDKAGFEAPVVVSGTVDSARKIAAGGNVLMVETDERLCIIDIDNTKKEICKEKGIFAHHLLVGDDGEPYVLDIDGKTRSALDKDSESGMRMAVNFMEGPEYHFNDAVIAKDGLIYATDSKTKEVVVLDKVGKKIKSWGIGIGEDKHLWEPYGIIVDANDRVYVTDMFNHAVQIFSSGGELLSTVDNSNLTHEKLLVRPVGLAFIEPNILYISDEATGLIHKIIMENN